jgi:hypothetical protein
MHANRGKAEAKHRGGLSSRRILTGLLCLILVVGCSSGGRADRDRGAQIGLLTIISFKIGKKSAITASLIDVSGDDWRITPR